MLNFKIENAERIIAMLKEIGALKFLKPSLKAAAEHVKGKIAKYPPSSEANQPRGWVSKGKNTWYVRGYGARWVRKDGTIRGRKTSEALGRKWTTKAFSRYAVVGNNVGYAAFVQDQEQQAGFHAARGWLTAQQVLESEKDEINKIIIDALESQLRNIK